MSVYLYKTIYPSVFPKKNENSGLGRFPSVVVVVAVTSQHSIPFVDVPQHVPEKSHGFVQSLLHVHVAVVNVAVVNVPIPRFESVAQASVKACQEVPQVEDPASWRRWVSRKSSPELERREGFDVSRSHASYSPFFYAPPSRSLDYRSICLRSSPARPRAPAPGPRAPVPDSRGQGLARSFRARRHHGVALSSKSELPQVPRVEFNRVESPSKERKGHMSHV